MKIMGLLSILLLTVSFSVSANMSGEKEEQAADTTTAQVVEESEDTEITIEDDSTEISTDDSISTDEI